MRGEGNAGYNCSITRQHAAHPTHVDELVPPARAHAEYVVYPKRQPGQSE
jgi:hypothetical protein